MTLKSLYKNFFFLVLFFSIFAWAIYYWNINGKIIAGLFTFVAILLAFSIRSKNNQNVRDIGSLKLDKVNKINIWKNSITYRYKKTAIRFLSLSRIYGIKVWQNGFDNINYFSNKDLQKKLKPKLYPKNYKINVWGNIFNKK